MGKIKIPLKELVEDVSVHVGKNRLYTKAILLTGEGIDYSDEEIMEIGYNVERLLIKKNIPYLWGLGRTNSNVDGQYYKIDLGDIVSDK